MADITTIEHKTVTQDMLLALEANAEDDVYFEVVDGDIVERQRMMGWGNHDIIRHLFHALDLFCEKNGLGDVYFGGRRFILNGTNKNIILARTPDLSFLKTGRLTAGFDPQGDFEGAPDLAVLVSHEGKSIVDLLKEIVDYLETGTHEVWLIQPLQQTVIRLMQSVDDVEQYKFDDKLRSSLFPNLDIALTDIFPPTP